MPVSYTGKPDRLTDPDGTGVQAPRAATAGEPAADFNDLDTWAQATTTLVNSLETGKADATHTHAAADVTSGTIATARLGTGTASSTTYLRGDSTWATVSTAASTLTVRTVTAAATLASSDDYVRVDSASAVTVTVPTGLATGKVIEVRQIGAGQVTLAGTGVTFTPGTALKTAGQHTSVRLTVSGTDAVDVDGGVA